MADNSTVVETVFTLVDQASAKVEKLSGEFITLQEQAMAAKAAVAKSAVNPGAPPPVTSKSPASASFEESQKAGGFTPEQRAAMRDERRVERERQWAAREAAEKHQIGSRIVLASAQMLGLSMQGTAGKIVQMGSMVGQIGIELSQFSGNVGKLGGMMAKAGGVLSSLSAGWAAGSWIDDQLGLSDKIAGVSSPAETRKANDAYVKGLGYRSSAEYEAAVRTQKVTDQQVKIEVAAKKYARGLGSLPANATQNEMMAFNTRLRETGLKVLREAGVPASEMGAVMNEVSKQAESGLAAQAFNMQERMAQDLALGEAVKKQARMIGGIPYGENRKEMEAFNARVYTASRTLLSSSDFFGVSMEEAGNMIMRAAGASLEGMSAQLREKTSRELEASDKEEGSLKKLNKMHLGKSVELRKAYNDALLNEATRISGEVYGKDTEEAGRHVEEIYRDLRTRTKLDKSKTSFDFRGSQFDIKQSFAEGIEPGDVSVAFTNDIAALAERSLTSGFTPIFGGG